MCSVRAAVGLLALSEQPPRPEQLVDFVWTLNIDGIGEQNPANSAEEKMSRTDAFARDCCKRMKEKPGSYNWECAGRPLGRGHKSIDIWGKPKRRQPRHFVGSLLRHLSAI